MARSRSTSALVALDASLQALTELAMDVFGSERDALAWLDWPHPFLAGARPRQHAMTSQHGAERVLDLLLRIKFIVGAWLTHEG